jgi:recombinational DNA repair protein (RecF pathway)
MIPRVIFRTDGPAECARCPAKLGPSVMSFFNEDILCLACAEEEKGCPNYAAARAAEEAAVAAGNTNFPGVGLKREDIAHLIGALARRG